MQREYRQEKNLILILSRHYTCFLVMFRFQNQWIRPAQDVYVVLLRTILFLNVCINGNNGRAPEKIVG